MTSELGGRTIMRSRRARTRRGGLKCPPGRRRRPRPQGGPVSRWSAARTDAAPRIDRRGASMPWQMTLGDILPPYQTQLWTLVKQVGVTAAVATIPDSPNDPPPWDYMHLLGMKQRFRDAGIDLQVIESAPYSIMEPIRLGQPNRDERIGRFCELLENMGRVGIPVICPNWMPLLGPLRTSFTTPGRGGAWVMSYDHSLMANAPLTEHGEITEEQLWERAEYF